VIKVVVGGAGGAPSEGVIYSLMQIPDCEVIGIGADPIDLMASSAHRKYLVPYANDLNYPQKLRSLLTEIKPDFIHFQNDLEIIEASKIRELFDELQIAYFFPDHEVIETCVYKWKSYLAFKKAELTVPKNILIEDLEDLKRSFSELRDGNNPLWLRSVDIGGGGKGAVATDNLNFAKLWIDRSRGWGTFVAAELLSNDTITWSSIWNHGELVVAQTRKRIGWVHGNRSVSGVTGVTKLGITTSDSVVDEIAVKAVHAVGHTPHGIYGVDMTYDKNGIPNPTEINIGRFFTTVRFFTEAGVNFPEIYMNLALGRENKNLHKKVNPLPDNLCWIRGMDRIPMLTTLNDLEKEFD
jgi:hypothetical protein